MRIKIEDTELRNFLFDCAKLNLGGSWKSVRNNLGVSRTTLDRYRSGEFLLPEGLFANLSKLLDEKSKKIYSEKIKKFPDNYGQIKGGKKAYLINKEKFDEGRKKGALSSRKRKGKKFEFSRDIRPEISEVIGAFIGDGFFNCYKNKLYQVEFAGDSRYDLNYYKEIVVPILKKVVLSANPHIYKVKSKNSIRIVFYSKELFCYLRDVAGLIPGKKTYTVKIPDKIMEQEELLKAAIRGIFDTDGSVFFDKRKSYSSPYPRITLQIKSKPLYEQLVNYLSKEFSLYNKYNSKKQIYVIEVYGIEQFKKWMSLIGFSNKRHLDRIRSSSSVLV